PIRAVSDADGEPHRPVAAAFPAGGVPGNPGTAHDVAAVSRCPCERDRAENRAGSRSWNSTLGDRPPASLPRLQRRGGQTNVSNRRSNTGDCWRTGLSHSRLLCPPDGG